MDSTPYQGTHVLVTGGAGVIGRELIARLEQQGARVLCCDLKPRPAQFGPAVEYRRGDINHLAADTVAAFAPEVVVHLAATFERSTESEEFWDDNFWHNVRLSHHLMTLLRESSTVRRVVFASSYLIYDPALYGFDAPQTTPVRLSEEQPLEPRNICGAAKLLHEIELRFLTGFEQARFTSVSARIFRSYGRGSADVVSRWVRELLADGSAELALYRKEGIFDYVFAGDVAEGLLRLGASDATGIVNLGSGRGRAVTELVEALRAHFPGLRTRDVEAEIPWEAHEADLTRLEALTGWRPEVTLEQGVGQIVAHERERLGQREASRADRPLNVMITSASRKVDLLQRYQAALDELGLEGQVWAADADPACIAARFADGSWPMPRLEDLGLDELIEFCGEYDIRLLVPTRDAELTWFAERADALAEAGIQVTLGDPAGVRDCLDKLRFAERCAEHDLPAIPTDLDLDRLIAATRATRFVVKERYGAGAEHVGLDLDREAALAHAAGLDEPIFQPWVEGCELSIDVYVARNGEVMDVVPRERRQVRDGESVDTATVEAPDLVAHASALCRAFDLRGHVVLQAFRGPTGVHLIECNPRYGGASALAFEAGLESPRWSLLEALGETLEPQVGAYRRGLRLLRYSTDRFEVADG